MKVAAKVPRAPDEHKTKVRNARNAKKKGHIVLLQERAKYAKNERESRGGPGWAQKGVLPIRPFFYIEGARVRANEGYLSTACAADCCRCAL